MDAENPAKGTFDEPSAASGADETPEFRTLSSPPGEADQGPCLYLGPSGQRCNRRALEGGFCAIHRPGAPSLPKAAVSKRTLAAILGALGLLWPFLADIVREIMRFIHPH
jgi:hypothetical protein